MPLNNEALTRNAICVSFRYALKTMSEPSNATYNVLVGCYTPRRYNTFNRESLVNEGLMRKSICVSVRYALKTTTESSNVTYSVLVGCYIARQGEGIYSQTNLPGLIPRTQRETFNIGKRKSSLCRLPCQLDFRKKITVPPHYSLRCKP